MVMAFKEAQMMVHIPVNVAIKSYLKKTDGIRVRKVVCAILLFEEINQ